jgi:hypothetical protein
VGTPDGPLTLRAEGRVRADTVQIRRAAQHEEMLAQVTILEVLIAELPNQPIDIGHNQQSITKDDVQEIKQAIAVLKAQPVAPAKARAARSMLKKVGERFGTYLDTFLLEASKSGGKEFGKRLVRLSYWLALWYTLNNLIQSITNWLH